MNRLRVIDGGRALVPVDGGKIEAAELSPLDLQAQVERVERDARMAAELVAPGMAIVGKSRAELMRMIATVDLGEAIRTHAVFKEVVTALAPLFEMLKAAEIRLAVAINTVAREGLATSDDA